jgi:hypothetical protein
MSEQQGGPAGMGGGLMELPDTEKVEVLSTKNGDWIGLDFHVTFPQETSATVVRVSLPLDQAGLLLALLADMQQQLGFPLPAGKISTNIIQ